MGSRSCVLVRCSFLFSCLGFFLRTSNSLENCLVKERLRPLEPRRPKFHMLGFGRVPCGGVLFVILSTKRNWGGPFQVVRGGPKCAVKFLGTRWGHALSVGYIVPHEGMVAWCNRCGAWAEKAPKHLKRLCGGEAPQDSRGWQILRRIRRKLPQYRK